MPKKVLFDVEITDATENKILEYIFSSVRNRQKPYYIVTPNPEIIMYAQRYPEFRSILNKAELALCDGIGLWLAGRVLHKPFQARVTGTDLIKSICREAVLLSADGAKKPVTVGLLGAGDGVALKAAERLKEEYPGLHVAFAGSEWSERGFAAAKDLKNDQKPGVSSNLEQGSVDEKKSDNLADLHNDKKVTNQYIDILFVAFGFPKQEMWMAENCKKLSATVMVGVGGAFDYISGNVPRAPGFMRSLGFEWLFRLIRQPWRVKRQAVLLRFTMLVLKEYLHQFHSKS